MIILGFLEINKKSFVLPLMWSAETVWQHTTGNPKNKGKQKKYFKKFMTYAYLKKTDEQTNKKNSYKIYDLFLKQWNSVQ